MRTTVRQYMSFGRPARVLLANEAVEAAGLLMLAPYLADHLTHRLGLAIWLAGFILALRHFSEGLFVIGGTLADRLGYKPMIVGGCLVKALGSALFGLSAQVSWLVAAAVLTGVASAFLIPANRAYLAQAESGREVEAFAMASVLRRIGILAGPLAGISLITAGFPLLCLISAGMFAALAVVQWSLLPSCPGASAGSGRPLVAEWREALRNRLFLAFAGTMFCSYALLFQLSFGLPLEVRRVSGGRAGVTALFVLSALLGLVFQVRLTLWCERRWTPGQAMARGLVLMGVAFVPLMLPPLHGGTPVRLLPLLACAAILTVGTMMVLPFELATIATLSRGRAIGTYYSVNNLLSGIGIVCGNLLSAAAMGMSHRTGVGGLPWLVLLALAVLSAAALTAVNRGDRLSPARLAPATVGAGGG